MQHFEWKWVIWKELYCILKGLKYLGELLSSI